ncbi:hypothetical protein MRB53_039361 [Persea americana]|nr:hypothetical protein MRB53_039361 [Persea americana]
MIKRSYDVIVSGRQSFEQRFPGKKRLVDDTPVIAQWRCNLTGLSSFHNLYFAAYGAEIYIYRPLFPSQSLEQSCLIIPSRPSSCDLHGYLDDRHPDHINNMIVTLLGNEEVVAIVRDNGDVDIFLTRHIVQTIQQREESDLDVVADEIRPMFQRNVGISAWGIAIHSAARIIAVSSNKHEVSIFKFALSQIETTSDNAEVEQEQDFDRHIDVTEQVLNGTANIPHIAFCNTGDDPEARWLLTTDIEGECRIIDLHALRSVQCFSFGRQAFDAYSQGYNRLNAGWTIMFLDPRSFQFEEEMNAAIGMQHDENLPDAKGNSYIWDLSKTTRHLTDVSNAFIKHNSSQFHKRSRVTASRGRSIPITSLLEDYDGPMNSSTTDYEFTLDASESNSPYTENAETSQDESDEGVSLLESVYPYVVDDLDDDDDEGTEDTTPANAMYNGERICGNFPRFAETTPLCDGLPCPIFHTSIRNVYMLQPINNATQEHWRPPFVGLAAPLRQSIQIDYHSLNNFERLNMCAYSASLGVLAVASQKGRVMIFALIKTSQSIQSRGMEGPFRMIYALRVEAIVPFKSQEEQNLRPFLPLHGLALGPMQERSKPILQKT